MSVTAKKLSKSGARGKEMDAIIREQLQIIDDRLTRAERTWGRNVVSHDLPTNLAMPGLDKRDAQRIVYCAIVRSLTARGFEVRLLLEEDRSAVYMAWVTDLDLEEIQAMNHLIKATRITRDKLSEFTGEVAAGGRPTQRDKKTEANGVAGRAPPSTFTAPAVSATVLSTAQGAQVGQTGAASIRT
jgi:hypothetical protein